MSVDDDRMESLSCGHDPLTKHVRGLQHHVNATMVDQLALVLCTTRCSPRCFIRAAGRHWRCHLCVHVVFVHVVFDNF